MTTREIQEFSYDLKKKCWRLIASSVFCWVLSFIFIAILSDKERWMTPMFFGVVIGTWPFVHIGIVIARELAVLLEIKARELKA